MDPSLVIGTITVIEDVLDEWQRPRAFRTLWNLLTALRRHADLDVPA